MDPYKNRTFKCQKSRRDYGNLLKPDKNILDEREGVEYFFKYFKHKKWKSKFLKVVVKYINEEGSILSTYFVRNIK